MSELVPKEVIGKLRGAVAILKKTESLQKTMELKDAVLARFQPIFAADHVAEITEDEFRSFLLLENNHHWSGLHRQGPRMCANMDQLRKALKILIDESALVERRLDKATEMVSGMGKNVASAILLIVDPERYGVWNNRSEANMKKLGILPSFDRGKSFGNRYAIINQIFVHLRDSLQVDLWTLDSLWWHLDQQESGDLITTELSTDLAIEQQQRFGLERHLHEFMRDNWDRLEIGRDWALYQEPGDEEAGYEYQCGVGRIDLLARHRTRESWLVVELKRGQTSDQTIGQLLRYIGWVKLNLAREGEDVHGTIVCHDADDALRYAMTTVPNVELRLYEVEFHLKKLETSLGKS